MASSFLRIKSIYGILKFIPNKDINEKQKEDPHYICTSAHGINTSFLKKKASINSG